MNKKIILHDTEKFEDACGFLKGKVQIKLAGTDTVLFEGFNKVTLMGAELLMRSLFFGSTTTTHLPVYKTIENQVSASNAFGSQTVNAAKFTTMKYDIGANGAAIGSSTEAITGHKCLWFAVGNDGCVSGQNFTVAEVQRNAPIAPASYIPFFTGTQATARAKALTGYGLAMQAADNSTYGLFAKQFAQAPDLHIVDGTDKIYTYNMTTVAGSLGYPNANANPMAYIEMKMAITAEDCRSFFAAISDQNRIINTISILAAIPANPATGIYMPRHTRPITKLNFPSESLADDSKGLDITYQIYF